MMIMIKVSKKDNNSENKSQGHTDGIASTFCCTFFFVLPMLPK